MTLSDLHDIRGRLEASPGQFGDRDESDAGENRVVEAVFQRHEHAEPLDRCDGAGKGLAAVQ